MESLNQAYRTAVEQLQKLSSGGKFALGVAVVLVIAGSCFYSQDGVIFNQDVELFAGRIFSDEEIMQAQAAFAKVGLNQHQAEAGRICVPKNQQARYVKALVKEDALPLELTTQLESKISSWGMFVDPQAKQEILRLAKQNQLAQIIQQMPDIHKVWVVLDKQQSKSLRRQEQHTASVSVQAHSGHPIGPYRIEQIRELVVRSVAGLNTENVAVIDINGEAATVNQLHNDPSQQDPYLARIKTYQEHYRGLILNCLGYIPGVTATVHVELPNEELSQHQAENNSEVRSMSGGTAEQSKNSVFAQFPLKQFLGGDSSKKRNTAISSTANRPASLNANSHLHQRISPTVTVAIGIPQTYFKRLWQEQHRNTENELRLPSADELKLFSDAEISRVRKTVAAVIPHAVADAHLGQSDWEKNVYVSTFVPFASDAEPTLAFTQPNASLAQTKDYELWLIAGFIGACVLLVIFWKPKRDQSASSKDSSSSANHLNSEGVVYEPSSYNSSHESTLHHSREAEEAETNTRHSAATKASNQSHVIKKQSSEANSAELRQEMANLVQNDPQAAAEVLKGWIGNRS